MKKIALNYLLSAAVLISAALTSCGSRGNTDSRISGKNQNVENNGQSVSEQNNAGEDYVFEAPFSREIMEIYPKIGRVLKFSKEETDEINRHIEAWKEAEWDLDKLTAGQREFISKHGLDGPVGYCEVWGENGWYCGGGGPDSVSASSYLKSNSASISYLPENAHDNSYESAWVEGVEGYGTGEYLTYYFSQTAPRVTTVIIANGYVKTEKAYRDNSRVKKLKMYINEKPFAILNLEDRRSEQIFEFDPIGRKRPDYEYNDPKWEYWHELSKLPKWTLKFEIIDVYKGDKYDDTVISELYFSGTDAGCYCFGAGTKILMSDNSLKKIESILAGDMVKSYDFDSKKLIDAKVTKLVSATHSNLLKLKFSAGDIVVTDDHPFWTGKNVWAAADAEKANKNYIQKTKVEKLQIGEMVFVPEKNIFSEIKDIENINTAQITYTIELSEGGNFIANGLLVKTETAK